VSNPSWQPWQSGQGDPQWARDVAQSGQDVPQPGQDGPRSGREASRAGHDLPRPWQQGTEAGSGLSGATQGSAPPPQSWQVASAPTQGFGQSWHGYGGPPMLAAHADRERAVDVLRAGYGEGRLEKGEFDQRVARAYTARTVGELAMLVADLPQGPVPVTRPVPPVPQTFLPAPVPTNGKAIGSMICGGLTFFTAGLTGIPAVILGHTARAEMQRTGERGEGLAMTGLVLGWLSVAGWLLVITILIAAGLASS
jgi:hypothetical protein